MSMENAKAFHEALSQDDGLQAKILTFVAQNQKEPDWHALATEAGYAITPEEALDYRNQLAEDDYELTDFELEMVAAGIPTSCSSDGA